MSEVSRPEHRSFDRSLALLAAREVRDGMGRMEELKLAAISRRALLISVLRSSNGVSTIESIFALRSLREGRELLSVTRVDSKVVGIVTFWSAVREGMVN